MTTIELDMSLVRQFLRSAPLREGRDLLVAACTNCEPAAIQLLLLALKSRANKRTRRSYSAVCSALAEQDPPKWLGVLEQQLFSLYSCLRRICIPTKHKPRNTMNLSRRQRFMAATGLVTVDRETLEEKARYAAQSLNHLVLSPLL